MRRKLTPFLLLLTTMLFVVPAAAQNCGCVEEGNCPETIAVNTSSVVCYTFTDAFNDDLSDPAQGVCGVNLAFTHDYIWDLELTLVSPGGQEVMLVGPKAAASGGTNFTSWDIQFVACGDTAEPEDDYEAVWTNDQDWPFVGSVGGSYYPVGGACLEDFNAGSVNGQWCLEINNEDSFTGGDLLDFEIILCDQSGIFCCDADGGDLDDDLITCEGDGALLLELMPDYNNSAPDTALYDYTFLVGEVGGLLLATTENPDLTLLPAGDYEVCGISYDSAEVDQVPQPDGSLTMQEIKDNLNGLNPSFCASLSDDCYPVTIVAPPPPSALSDTICQGEDYIIGDSTFTAAGDYEVIFNSFYDCDSLVNLSLTVLTTDTAFITEIICLGESLTVGDSVFTATGNYEVYRAGAAICDSTYLVDLTVVPPVTEDVTATICPGEEYFIGTTAYTDTGIYTDTITSVLTGCDSIVNLDLEVIIVNAEVAPPAPITCDNPTTELDGTASTSAPGTTYQWTVFAGGNIVGDDNQPVATVDDNGIYQLEVTRFGCADTALVNVLQLTTPPTANAGTDDSLTCVSPSIQLDGTASETDDSFNYLWTTADGNIFPGEETILTPTVDIAPAFYYLTVTNTETGCEGIDSVFISLADDTPQALAGPDAIINCQTATATLDGSASYVDETFTYVWTNAAGDVLPESAVAQIEVTDTGIYTFTITDTATGCSASDTAEVTDDFNFPVVEAGATDTLTCQSPDLQLAGGVDGSTDFTVLWTGPGDIVGETTLTPDIYTSGWYYLSATDADSQCTATDSVFIAQDTDLPVADAGPQSVTLNCQLESFTIGDAGGTSVGTEFMYQWFLEGAEIADVVPLEVSEAGIYILTVTNTETGCSRSDSTQVFKNLLQPIAYAGEDFELDCETGSIILDGEELSELPDDDDLFIEYIWYDADYQIIQTGEDSLLVVNPGVYRLVLSESITFCADTASVTITQDPAVPLADAGADMFLDCETGTATLDGTGSSAGDFSYQWSSDNGGIILNDMSLTPIVNTPGTYVLEVSSNTDNCTDLDEVQVSLDTTDCGPIAVILPGLEVFGDGENGIIDCTTEDQAFIDGTGYFLDTLDATGSTPPSANIVYTWTSADGIVYDEDNPQIPIVTEGTFILTVTNVLLGISAQDTVTVLDLRNFPAADAGENVLLNCTNFQNGYILDGTESDQGTQFSYLWTTEDGDFGESDVTEINPTVFAAGTYDLEVTDNENGCVSNATVLLTLDGQVPTPCFVNEIQAECGGSTLIIGDTCAVNPDYAYAWTVISNGTIFNDTDTPMIEISTDEDEISGLFAVTVTDLGNNCTFTDTVEVFTAVNCFPLCVVDPDPDTLTCLTESITLDGTGSSFGNEFSYTWTQEGDNTGFCGSETTLTPCINEPGVYYLTVSNTATGFSCQSADITVFADNQPPQVFIDDTDGPALTCTSETVILSADSDDTDIYAFQWVNADGCILTDPDLPSVEVNCAVAYTLNVTDLSTGCINTSTYTVVYDTLPPAVATVSPSEAAIGCTNPQVILSGSGSSSGLYAWYLDGDLIAGATNLTYSANTAGEYCLVITDADNGCSTESACAIVTADTDAVAVSAGENQFLTCSSGTAMLTGEIPAGDNFTFEWTTDAGAGCISPPTGSLNISTDCPGFYTLTVTDQNNGCVGAATVEVIDATAPPVVDAGPNLELDCNVTEVTLQGSATGQGDNFIINWVGTDGQGNPSPGNIFNPVVTAPGVYSLAVYNEDTDCFAVDEVTVFQAADLPVTDAGADMILTCEETEVILDGNNSAENDSLSYLWSAESGNGILTNPTQREITVDAAGNYIFTVTNDSTNCVNTDTVAVLTDTLTPQFFITLENEGVLNCLTESITLNAENSLPVGSLSFLWTTLNGDITTPADEPQITVAAPGGYQLQLTDEDNGCVADTSVTVVGDFAPPSVEIVPPAELTCINDSVVLDASTAQENSVFVWSNAEGLPIDGTDMPVAVVFEPGEYILELTSEDNGCADTTAVTVIENREPPAVAASADGVLDCLTDSIEISGIGSAPDETASYIWTGAAPVADPTALETFAFVPGIYTLTVTNDGNGCADSVSVEVMSVGLPITDIEVSQINPDCADLTGGFIRVEDIVGGSAPYVYSFGGGAYTAYDYRNYLTAGTYTVAVEDADGCGYEITVTLEENEALVIDLGADIEVERGEEVTLSLQINLPTEAVDTVIWQPLPDAECPGCTEQTFTPEQTMVVSAEVRDTFGCTATEDIFLYIIGGDVSPIFVPNAFSPDGDGDNDELVVYAKSFIETIDLFQIFDRWGNMVWEARNFAPNNPTRAWHGTLNGEAVNTQVLTWRAEYKNGGESVTEWGDVTLLR